jgi:hypothetical protein
MHKDYTGTRTKGVPAFEGWCSMARTTYIKRAGQPRGSVRQLRKPTTTPLVPRSVLCAPTAASWTTTHWTVGASALKDFVPRSCEAPELTVPDPAHGWDDNTPPEIIFNHFFPISFRRSMIGWSNDTAVDRGADR